MPTLTPKMRAFAEAFIELNSQADAYRKAYNAAAMADATVHVKACELMKKPAVAACIAELQAAHRKRHEVTVDRIVRELALIGFANMADYITTKDDGSAYVDLSKLTRDQAAAIGEVTSETYTEGRGEDAQIVKRTKFKLIDKRGSLVDLGRHLGMFAKDNEQAGKAAGEAVGAAIGAALTETERARRIAFIMHKATRLNGDASAEEHASGA